MNDMNRLRGRATSARAWMIAIGSSVVTPLMSGSAPAGLFSVAVHDGQDSCSPGGSGAEHQGQRGVASVICALYSLESRPISPKWSCPVTPTRSWPGGLLLMS